MQTGILTYRLNRVEGIEHTMNIVHSVERNDRLFNSLTSVFIIGRNSMINCSLCLSKVGEKDNFCKFCGAKLKEGSLLRF